MKTNFFSNEENDLLIRQNIEIYGWHVIKINEEENFPAYGYSIGLFETFNHPEIILMGPEVDIIHFMINKIGDVISNGNNFKSGFYYPSLVQNANLHFSLVDDIYYTEYVAHATHFYKDNYFPLLQCLYPAPNGSYPGEAEFPKEFNTIQPFLGKAPIIPIGYQNQAPQSNIKLPLPQFDK